MIAYLDGEPVMTGDRWVVLAVNGIGYRVIVPHREVLEIARASGKVELFTYMAVREDVITLYGFLHQSEREMFAVLLGVSGIGPQIAMNILTQIAPEDLVLAIVSEDEKSLTRVPGIGTKSAKRLILELRDKMKKVRESMPPSPTGRTNQNARDAVSALVSLGFAEKAAGEAVASAVSETDGSSVQVLNKVALVRLRER